MRSTRDVLDHHLQCFGAGDLEGTLADYTPDSALLTPEGALRGLAAIREFFALVDSRRLPLHALSAEITPRPDRLSAA
jgi:hypothetical protein